MRLVYKLTLCFLLISLLVGIQAYIGYNGAISIHERYTEVSNGTLPVLEDLNTLRVSGLKVVESTDEILMLSLDNNEYIDYEINEIAQYSKIFEGSFQTYKTKVDTQFPDEKEYSETINASVRDMLRLSSELVYLKKNGNNGSQIDEKREDFAKSENKFLAAINLALENEKDELNEKTKQTDNVMVKLKSNSLSFGIISFLLALVMGYYLSNRISGPIVKLNNASYEIIRGNLDTKIEINTKDEIEELCTTFNNMAQNLKNSNNETNLAIKEQKNLTNKISRSLEEKEVLLREIHHRVKNNMQIISSLLLLQSDNIKDKQYKDIFIDSQNQIQAMFLIHQKLYQSENLAQINFKEYITEIVTNISESYGQKRNIKIVVNAENIPIKIDDAVPCGLIINELVTNSFKYAFPDGRPGKIQISVISTDNNTIQLSISDDGIGIAKDLDIRNTASLGLKLVTGLAESQLHGQIKLNRENGTEFQINFRQGK